ncbi:MAG: flagellar basal body rod C-terminal domain-containing protein, partial [Rhodocyclaceae bacterium]|nr:flagellar basal body rod C-terminal domain-containing protein [Rhodocyclaceae bacterium]
VEVTGKAQQTLADQAQNEVDKMSGVNLDEEAANLLRYQQAYQASAKLIEIAGRLFDEILALNR